MWLVTPGFCQVTSIDIDIGKNSCLWNNCFYLYLLKFHGPWTSPKVLHTLRISKTLIVNYFVNIYFFLSNVSTAPSGPGPPDYRGFTITLRHTTLGRTPLDEWPARRRDLYLTTHNTHKRQTSMPPVGFEPTITASERPQTDVLDRTATGINVTRIWKCVLAFNSLKHNGYYMNYQLGIKELSILLTECIYMFHMILRKTMKSCFL
jgi:hypothetical protein